MYGIFEEDKETISLHDTICVKTSKATCKGKVMSIPYSDISYDEKYLKTKWLDTKTEERLFKRNVSLEYMKNRVPNFTQNYFSGAHMEESVHDLTIKISQHKK